MASQLARFILLMCGRRWGKTLFGVERACRKLVKGGNVGWFAPQSTYAAEAWRELRRRLSPLAVRISEQEKRIELVNGAVLEVWSLHDNQDPARGREYDLVIIDEAGLVAELDYIWQTAIEPTLVVRRGSALFLGTPKGQRTSFVRMHSEAATGDDPDWWADNAPSIENPAVPPDEVERARKRAERNGTMGLFYQEYFGIPADDGSNPIGYTAIARAIADEPSKHPTVCYGVDLARAVDHTVVIGLDAAGHWTECHRFQAGWRETRQRVYDIIGKTPTVVDATGVGDPIVEDLLEAGCDVHRFVFSPASRRRLVQELVTAFHSDRMKIPGGWLKAELESLGVEELASGPRYAVPRGMHDDGIMALGLAWIAHQSFAPMLAPQNTAAWKPRAGYDDRISADGSDYESALFATSDDGFDDLGDGW